MTYEHDFERNRMASGGTSDYQTSHDTGGGTGKWLLLALVFIVLLLGAAAFFSGEATVTFNDGSATSGQVESTTPAPAPAPAAE
ncbi:MAG: hypothetical protein AAGA76_03640 [Pseudomonadota bacterium]